MRVFTATLGTETASNSPIPTGWRAFEETMLWRPGAHPDSPTEATGPLWACRQRSKALGWTVVEGTCAFAMPGGPVPMPVYEALRDEILSQLREALPVDIVALGLHGAMMADACEDCEGDLLSLVRSLVGPDVAVGAVLDCHAHHTSRMQSAADVLIYFREYPHTDYVERSHELLDLLVATRRGSIRPVMQSRHCRMMATMPTTTEPIKGFVRRMTQAIEGPVLSVSLVHGFGAGDVPEMGAQILVVCDADDGLARQTADRFAEELFALREQLRPCRPSQDEVFANLLNCPDWPVILADVDDNPGGGAAGDSTEVLRALISRGIRDACIGPFWDPVAVRLCFDAGVGARLRLRIGGKVGPDSGEPLDVLVEVVHLTRGHTQKIGEFAAPLGDCAAIAFEGLEVVLTSVRDQAYSPELFNGVGIDCAKRRIIVVKSAQQFRIGFEPLSRHIFNLWRDPRHRNYKNVRRPIWPLDEITELPEQVT